MPWRLFIASDVPPSEKILSYLSVLNGLGKHFRTVRPENLHFTLRFLGEVEESRITEISAVMERAVRGLGCNKDELKGTIRGMGAFPNARRPRVIWIGLEGPAASTLKRTTEGLRPLDDLGFREDKPFTPHLTLARIKIKGGGGISPYERKKIEEMFSSEMDIPYTLTSLKLKRSVLSSQGPSYSDVFSVPFGNTE